MVEKASKGIKKTAKATYNFVIGEDIKTLKSKKTKWYQKAFAAVSIASNFIPGGALVTKATKLAIKGTVAVGKSIKAAKKVTKTVKSIKRTAKKASHVIKKKPKTPPASSIQSSKKLNHKPASPGKQMTPTKAPPKSSVAKTPERKTPQLRSEAVAGDNVGSKLRSGDKIAKGTGESGKGLTKIDDHVDLTGFRKDHILNRHRAGVGKGKDEFPSSWSDERILHQVSDIATDPKTVTGVGKWNSPYAIGIRDRVKIRVDFYPNTHPNHAGKISTAYPLGLK